MFAEYEAGRSFKGGTRQARPYMNRARPTSGLCGDQWYGARCGNDRPLVRHNVIKRIGDYKMAVVSSNPVTVNYSVEGGRTRWICAVPPGRPWTRCRRGRGQSPDCRPSKGDHRRHVSPDRLFPHHGGAGELDDLKEQALRNAYIAGTGVLYTYWDDRIKTGLYADEALPRRFRGHRL